MKVYVAIDTLNRDIIAETTLKETVKTALETGWFDEIYNGDDYEYVTPKDLYGEDWNNHILQMDLHALNKIVYPDIVFFEAGNGKSISIN